ncbi:MAG TPA: PQQ-dependent sugar dehydrogenase [Blastocatellia bacterium]|nr:PQQ-dependent sugar dehydrogenase [Blastocatellia bacterium]
MLRILRLVCAAALTVLLLASTQFIAPASTQQRQAYFPATGFEMNIFADLASVPDFAGPWQGPASLAFDSRGRLFVGTLNGKIQILLDNDDDGAVDQVKTFATGIVLPLGLEFRANGDLFATSNIPGGAGRIIRLRDSDGDDVADQITTIVDGLPSDGEHHTDKPRFGKDGLLYFGQGSSSDKGEPEDGYPGDRPLNSKILRVDVDNPNVSVFASGVRNPYGLVIHPDNGAIFCTDVGSGDAEDAPSPDLSPPEEINWIVEGGNYGFPLCDGMPEAGNPACTDVRAPVFQFRPHLTPTALAFYTGPQAGEFRNQLLVTLFFRLWGQGGELRRLVLTGDTATGFHLSDGALIADFDVREDDDGPVDMAIDPITGDIYVSRVDLVPSHAASARHNFIYRIHRTGSDSVPFIAPVRPSTVEAGSGMRTITIPGRHFKPGAIVLADGLPVTTRPGANRFELEADIFVGAASHSGRRAERVARTITIEVENPDRSRSNPQTLTVTEPDIDDSPRLASLAVMKGSRVVTTVRVGAKAKKLRLVAAGSNFDPGAQLLVGGAALELTSTGPLELIGRFTKAMVASPGELTVQVRNSTGKLSNALKLVIVP